MCGVQGENYQTDPFGRDTIARVRVTLGWWVKKRIRKIVEQKAKKAEVQIAWDDDGGWPDSNVLITLSGQDAQAREVARSIEFWLGNR